jgi:hypothetical protein
MWKLADYGLNKFFTGDSHAGDRTGFKLRATAHLQNIPLIKELAWF